MNLRKKEQRKVPRRFQDDEWPASPVAKSNSTPGASPDERKGGSQVGHRGNDSRLAPAHVIAKSSPTITVPLRANLILQQNGGPPGTTIPPPTTPSPRQNAGPLRSVSPLQDMANIKRVRPDDKSKGPREPRPRGRPPKSRHTQHEPNPGEELRHSFDQSLNIRSGSVTPPQDFRAAKVAAFPSLPEPPTPKSPSDPCGLDALALLEDRHSKDAVRRAKSYETVDNMYSSKAFPDDLPKEQKRWYLSLKMRPDMAVSQNKISFSSLYYSLRQTIMDRIREQVPLNTFTDSQYHFYRLLRINGPAELSIIYEGNAQGWPDDIDVPHHLAELKRLHPGMILDPDLPPPLDLIKAVHFLMQHRLPGSLLGEWQFQLPNPAEIPAAVPAHESPHNATMTKRSAPGNRIPTLEAVRAANAAHAANAKKAAKAGNPANTANVSKENPFKISEPLPGLNPRTNQNQSAPKTAAPTLPSLRDQLQTAASTTQPKTEDASQPLPSHQPFPLRGGGVGVNKNEGPAQSKRPALADATARRPAHAPAPPMWSPLTPTLPPNAPQAKSDITKNMNAFQAQNQINTAQTQTIPPFARPPMQHAHSPTPPLSDQPHHQFPNPTSTPHFSSPFGPPMYGRTTTSPHSHPPTREDLEAARFGRITPNVQTREQLEAMNPYRHAVRNRVPLYDPTRDARLHAVHDPRHQPSHQHQHQLQHQVPQSGGPSQHQSRYDEAQAQAQGQGQARRRDGDVDTDTEMSIDPALVRSSGPGNGDGNGMVMLNSVRDVERYTMKRGAAGGGGGGGGGQRSEE
ncbi:hypothetical protein BDV96DRAFT_640252 [Lophiotrema nucula]|uniref:Uncharacterized protein n=1 Tax=Lophiotrema nucula TaxID=690887 RepID=A0A6A5ZRS6_9PLEO|nr:hypothetical protein BDV96DRAFT_640252 [Lophiotrema nucula]